jgi:hypothetical protein
MAIVKLTPALLRKIVNEEKQKLVKEAKKKEAQALAKAEEVDADGFADTLENPKDHQPKNENRKRYQNLVIQENALLEKLEEIRKSKRRIVKNARS